MFWGLLSDETSLQDDPAKMALFGAAGEIRRSGGNNLASILRSGLEGAGIGYGAYQQYQLDRKKREQEALQAQQNLIEQQLRISKGLYDLQAPLREQKKLEDQQNQRNAEIERIRALGLPKDQTDLLLAMRPEDASRELGEIRNERQQGNLTMDAMRNYMQQRQVDPLTQAVAEEIFAAAPNKVQGYGDARRFLQDSGVFSPKTGKGNTPALDVETYAATLPQMLWDKDGKVREMAINIVQQTGDVMKAENYIEAARSRIVPEETEDGVKMNASGVVTIKGFKPRRGTDGLFYHPQTGQLLPGGQVYKMAADGSGLIQRDPDKDQRTALHGNGIGLKTTIGLADSIQQKRSQLGLQGVNVKLSRLMNPQELAALGSEYILTLMGLKDKFALGAITGPDMEILTQAIENPIGFLNSTNADSLLRQLEVIQKSMWYEFDKLAKTQNYNPTELWKNTYQQTQPAPFGLAGQRGRGGQLPGGGVKKSQAELEWEASQQ